MTYPIQRQIGIAGLVLGPLTFAVADLLRRFVEPSSSVTDGKLVAAIHDRPGLWLTAGLLSAASAFLFLPGIVAIVARARGRGAALTQIGGYLFAGGVLASIGHMSEYFGVFGTYEKAGINDRTIKQLGAASYLPGNVFIAVFLVGMFLGLLLMMIGLRRSGAIPIWAVVAALVAIVVGSSGGVSIGVIGVIAWLTAFIPVARAIAAESMTVPGRVDQLSAT